ncbi:MAG: FtsX-like permease family protein [Clostridium sp.]
MRGNIVDRFLGLGFLITTFLIMITISSLYPIYQDVVEENNLWDNFEQVWVDFNGSELTHREFIKKLEDREINNYFALPVIYMNEYGEKGLTENIVMPITEGFNIKNFMTIEGEFSKDDLDGKSKSVIIGENLNKNTVEVDGKRYLELYGENFEVIGQIKDTKAFPNFTIVPLKSLGLIDIKMDDIGIGISKLEKDRFLKINEDMGYKTSVYGIKKQSVIEEIFKRPTEIEDRLVQMFLGMMNISMFSYFYTKMVKRDLAVMRVLGADNKYIFKELFRRIIKVAGSGALLGAILTQVAIMYFREINPVGYEPLTLGVIIVTIALIIILSLIISLISVLSVARFKVLKEIR